MEEILEIIATNHMPLVFLLGCLLCIAGAVLAFTSNGKTQGVILCITGVVFASLPFITSVKFNSDGLELLTNTQIANQALAKTIEDQTKAIEELRSGLAAVQVFSQNAITLPGVGGGSTTTTPSNFENFKENLGNSLQRTDDFLNGIQTRQQSLDQILQKNDVIIDKLGTGRGLENFIRP